MADVLSGSESIAELTPQQDFNVQAHLRSEGNQIAFLNAVLSEGHPDMLVGAIWDVMRAIGLVRGSPDHIAPEQK